MIDSGFYILVNLDFVNGCDVFNMIIGSQYQEDNLKSIRIESDGKFMKYYENDNQRAIRDLDTTNSFEETVASYINLLVNRFPKSVIVTQVDGEYVNYFDEE